RYGMTQNLLDAIKPVKIRYEGDAKREAFSRVKRESYDEIINNGGSMRSYGLHIPPPQRARFWRDKQGRVHKTQAVPKNLGTNFLDKLNRAMDRVEADQKFNEELDNAIKPSEFPF
ncbi:MAG TPA: hypothetical protein VEF34_10340, partial [Syntrophobacteraceae bacterium]|nr:hypothetical protein [Syntrophobacteraceae bacterium]